MNIQHITLIIALTLLTGFAHSGKAQTTSQKIGENPTAKNAAAVLELESTNKGLLFPRVTLSNTTTWGLAGTATRGMVVYNTQASITAGSTTYPVAAGNGTGLYVWDGAGWTAFDKTADTTNDAWVNDNTNTQVKLGTKSNGTAARDTGTEFVIKDDGKVGIGLTAPTRPLEVNGEAKALRIIARGPGNFPTNLALGDNSLASLTTGTFNAAVGPDALKANTTGGGNTAVGNSALLKASTGNNNTAIGKEAMSNVTTGVQNVAIGTSAMGSADAGSHNVAVGYNAGLKLDNVGVMTNNTFIGWQSGLNTSSGTGNTFIGGSSGLDVTTGSNNTIIGSYTGSATINNNIVLSDGAGNQRIRVIDDGKTGIGTTTPQKQLHVDGALQITNELNVGGTGTTAGSAGTAGQVLTSAGANLPPVWSSPSGGGGDTTNDAWINDNANTQVKLGTQSDGITSRLAGTEFVIKNTGNVGVGEPAPSAKLEVNGNVEIGTVDSVGENLSYKDLVWNTSTHRVETSKDFDNISKTVTVAAGATSGVIYSATGSMAYRVKVFSRKLCGAAFYNEFIVTGSTSVNSWVLNYLGGMSHTAVPTATKPNNSSAAVTNPSSCTGDTNNFNLTLSVGPGTGVLNITNNSGASRTYRVTIEKIFDNY